MNSHYLFLCSEDSKEMHHNNNSSDFIVELPFPYNLDGKWECSLIDLIFFPPGPNLAKYYIFCDICVDSYVKNNSLPCLRVVGYRGGSHRTFSNPFYVSVKQQIIQRVHVYIRDSDSCSVSFTKGYTCCTLHLRKVD